MDEIFYAQIEYDGKKCEHTTFIKMFTNREKAESFLAEQFERAKAGISNLCDNVSVETKSTDGFEVQGDDYDYWETGLVSSQVPE